MRKTRPLSSSELSSALEVAGEISGTPAGTVTLAGDREAGARRPVADHAAGPLADQPPGQHLGDLLVALGVGAADGRPPSWGRRPPRPAPRRAGRTCGRRRHRRRGRPAAVPGCRSSARMTPGDPLPRRSRRRGARGRAPLRPRVRRRARSDDRAARARPAAWIREAVPLDDLAVADQEGGPGKLPHSRAAVPAGALGQPEGGGDVAPVGTGPDQLRLRRGGCD